MRTKYEKVVKILCSKSMYRCQEEMQVIYLFSLNGALCSKKKKKMFCTSQRQHASGSGDDVCDGKRAGNLEVIIEDGRC